MDESLRGIAQPRDSMFLRNVGHMASRGREAQVRVSYQSEPIVGFFAGLDEGYVQVCVTSDQTLEMVDRSAIVSVKETGRTLSDLHHKLDAMALETLRKKIDHFQRKMSFTLGRKQQR